MMGDRIEELIKEIAVKHGIAVSRDDPILVLHTINNRLLQDSSKAQQIQLTSTRKSWKAWPYVGDMTPRTRQSGS